MRVKPLATITDDGIRGMHVINRPIERCLRRYFNRQYEGSSNVLSFTAGQILAPNADMPVAPTAVPPTKPDKLL